MRKDETDGTRYKGKWGKKYGNKGVWGRGKKKKTGKRLRVRREEGRREVGEGQGNLIKEDSPARRYSFDLGTLSSS